MNKRDQQIVDRYLGGTDSVTIGGEFGLTGDRIRQILEREGISRRKDYRIKFDYDEIERLYARSGYSVSMVAKGLGCCTNTVRTALKSFGYDLRQKPTADPTEIVERYQAGETQAAIGDSLGVSQATVSKRIREAGLTYKDRSKV